MFEVKDVDLAGRIGRLRTKSGVIETPAFFPVIDPARQELPLSEIREAGFNQVITNAYLLYKRSRGNVVPVHKALGWDGVVMTDSGAYQILEYGDIDVSQDEILEYQKAVGTDIGVILDIPTGDVDRERARQSVEETLRRAREALKIIDPSRDDTIWVLPIQGGRHLDLVAESATKSLHLPYRMYGIGSPTVFLDRYMYDVVVEIVHAAKRALPPGKPVHLFGAGHPLIIPFVVALGVDTFDSASYILYARDNRYMTEYGVYRLEDLDYFPCECPICRKYTPRDLLEMDKQSRTRLLALHNLHVIDRILKRVKQAIKEGRLWELLEETARKHPAAHSAFAKFRKFHKYLETHTPTSKGRVHGLRVYGRESLWNPKLTRFQSRVLVKLLASARPSSEVRLARLDKDRCTKTVDPNTYYIDYYVGVVPSPLCGTYPSIHVDYGSLDHHVASHLENIVSVLVHKLASRGVTRIRVSRDVPQHVRARLASAAAAAGVEVVYE